MVEVVVEEKVVDRGGIEIGSSVSGGGIMIDSSVNGGGSGQ